MNTDSKAAAQARVSDKNLILKQLPEDVYARLLPDLEPVELALGQVIYRAEDEITHIYFLCESLVSLVAATTQGQSAEIGIIGYEGLVGMEALMGSSATLNQCIVQHPDGALRIKVNNLKAEFVRGGRLLDRFLTFTRLLNFQIGQTSLCNRFHTVEERLSRWLLICRDRTRTDNLQLTQEFLSLMLGVNRATVTISAIALQSANFIRYTRGRITIIDAVGLEDFSCECYGTIKKEYDRA